MSTGIALTESEWFESSAPADMLEFLNGGVSERKLRLFACACCQRIRSLVADERLERLLDLSELYADGLVDRGTLLSAAEAVAESWVAFRSALAEAVWATGWAKSCTRAAQAAAQAVGAARAAEITCARGYSSSLWLEARSGRAEGQAEEQAAQCELLRDIAGNPFQPVPFLAAWREAHNGEVVSLARRIYEEKSFEEMPRLAEALERAGCEVQEVLEHCRTGPHVRGCWLVDVILEKT